MDDSGPRAQPPNAGEVEQAVAVERNIPEQNLAVAAPAGEPAVYIASVMDGALWCCEILSGVNQHRQSFQSLRAAEPELETIIHPQCIIISQDCDLEQDFRARQNNAANSLLRSVLLCEVSAAAELKGNVPAGKDIWKRIIQNKDERYQYLSAVPAAQDAANEGLPELGIDFRRYFTVPTEELYEQFQIGARRRCHLQTPFKEHFMVRLTYFMARVGLPFDHH